MSVGAYTHNLLFLYVTWFLIILFKCLIVLIAKSKKGFINILEQDHTAARSTQPVFSGCVEQPRLKVTTLKTMIEEDDIWGCCSNFQPIKPGCNSG